MLFSDLVEKNRSYRRFDESRPIERATLVEFVDMARHTPSAANRQPLKFMVSDQPDDNARIFSHLRWAAALSDWSGPAEGERPTGYIVILGDTAISKQVHWDDAIAAQTILLAATERELGGCMVGSIDREGLRTALGIPGHLEISSCRGPGKAGRGRRCPRWRESGHASLLAGRSGDSSRAKAGTGRSVARLRWLIRIRGGLLAAVVDCSGDLALQVGASYDAVDEAVLKQELARLEPLGQFDMDGLL